ncbi:hypothetical protein [Fictibacillus barbaricus]|uniref:Uncharacterized protein n=1 Tax=Fictibacillus barbaricus TaxID=182136 RepID=A0ABS2ZH57_9BACL|nr:hypothetical protein [Fictibacillus barbaricus]MBN3546065.1 hypothetical protein [Fictibacillus barbaricus]GGB58357.1 hypothetical protein GCM10007199_25290 [Fictibacillus barbaricus]
MRAVRYNERKVCDLTSTEYDGLCLLLPYWGLQISDDGETITGALSTFMLGIQGLSQERVKELDQLLMHTGIKITSDDHVKCDQRFYVAFHSGHPMPLALNTPDKQLYYLNPSPSFRLPIQSGIHRGITLKRKDGPLFLAVQPSFEDQIAEWISYLVIQTFLRFSFESLSSISESTFFACADKVLKEINTSFASIQIPLSHHKDVITSRSEEKADHSIITPTKKKEDEKFIEAADKAPVKHYLDGNNVSVPQIRPFSSAGSLITNHVPKPYEHGQFLSQNAKPINPFKPNNRKEKPIQPFNTNPSDPYKKSVIRPFHPNQNTPSAGQEYTDKTSRIFRQRRDGK